MFSWPDAEMTTTLTVREIKNGFVRALIPRFGFLCGLLLLLFPVSASAQSGQQQTARPSPETIREWQSRKYGMFIHFGLYSTLGGMWKGKQYSGNYSEQIESDAHIPEAEYAALASKFDPAKWDPDAIVQLAIDAGMKFIVLTAKHHDGFSLFATKQSTFNSVEATPFKRDIVKSLAEACAKRGMPFGVYYSTIDWHFGDVPQEANDNPISRKHEEFNAAQLRELMTGYGPLTEIWFDMGHPTPLQSRHFVDVVHGLQPECMISGRVCNNEGDFSETGDDAIPDYIQNEPWESPASIFADTWGYRSWEKRGNLAEKTREEILRLVKVVSRGGNYILNIGPEGDGSVVPFEAEVLRGAGQWLRENGDAIYGTQPQPFRKLSFGYATVKDNRLYLFVERLPVDGKLELPRLQNRIQRAYWLNSPEGSQLRSEETASGRTVLAVSAPSNRFLPVVALEFEGKLSVLSPAVQPDATDKVFLTPGESERSYNLNGEGYQDPPTVHGELWHFAVKRAGLYRVELKYKPGRFSRAFDVQVGDSTIKAIVQGDHASPATVGTVVLARSRDTVLSINRASPAERAAKLDVDFTGVVLTYVGPAPNARN
jgi:alpha-L-fucosidase